VDDSQKLEIPKRYVIVWLVYYAAACHIVNVHRTKQYSSHKLHRLSFNNQAAVHTLSSLPTLLGGSRFWGYLSFSCTLFSRLIV